MEAGLNLDFNLSGSSSLQWFDNGPSCTMLTAMAIS
jgi:hypothetical protein